MGCDCATCRSPSSPNCFNPRIPCGMRQDLLPKKRHAARFQSMHPVWDATPSFSFSFRASPVSIHASRVGCDRQASGLRGAHYCFNPCIPCGMRRVPRGTASTSRSFNPCIPCGMRPLRPYRPLSTFRFQSMHPVWDATAWKLTVDGQWCSCRFAPTCLSCCYLQVRSFYSNDVNVLKSRLYENRRSAGNFL